MLQQREILSAHAATILPASTAAQLARGPASAQPEPVLQQLVVLTAHRATVIAAPQLLLGLMAGAAGVQAYVMELQLVRVRVQGHLQAAAAAVRVLVVADPGVPVLAVTAEWG